MVKQASIVLQIMKDILHHSGTNPKEKKKTEDEQ